MKNIQSKVKYKLNAYKSFMNNLRICLKFQASLLIRFMFWKILYLLFYMMS